MNHLKSRYHSGLRRLTFRSAPALLLALLAVMLLQIPGFSTIRSEVQAAAPAETPSPYVPQVKEAQVPPPLELPAPLQALPDVPNRPLAANEAVTIALVHQPQIKISVANVEFSKGFLRQESAALLPTVNSVINYTGSTPFSGSGTSGGSTGATTTSSSALSGVQVGQTGGVSPFSGYQMNVIVSQLVFDFNHTRDLVRQARAQYQSAAIDYTRAQADLALQVKLAFYTYAQNARLVTVNEKNVSVQQQHLTMAKELFQAGTGLPSDVVRAQTAVSDAIFNLTQARANALNSRVNLANIMGIDPRIPINASDEAEPEIDIVPAEKLYDQALKDRPEIHKAESDVEASQYGLSAAGTSNAPILTSNSGWFGRDNQLPPGSSYFNTGLTLNINLYNGGETLGLIEQAQANKKKAVAQLDYVREVVISNVSSSYLNYVTAKQKMDASEAEMSNAQEALRLTEGRFKAGVGIFLEVLDAQSALLQAATNRVNARSALDQAKASLAHAIGLQNWSSGGKNPGADKTGNN